jgi:WD40 repeat protein
VDQKRWIQIEEVLQQALDLEPSQRTAFLKQIGVDDPTLLAKVQALLNQESQAESFLESPAAALLQQTSCDPPSQIRHYKIESRIGAGGMGEIYKARDETLGRVVALKMLPLEFTSDPERVQRFRLEALAASRLNHPNIITIFEIVQQDDNHFIAEEYVEGHTLTELLTNPQNKNQQALRLEKVLEIAIQTARALKAAHTAWIIHRDIKPENIMIREDGLVKVVDFGIAKLGDERGVVLETDRAFQSNDPSLTVPGLIMGTASYMSPEQARGEQLDGRTDLFSLGVLLYEMTTGSRLFAGSTRFEALDRLKQSDTVVRQALKLGQIPKELQRILRRLLQTERDERYGSAGELLEDLIRFKQRLESRTMRRIAGVSALAVVLAVAVVAFAAFLSINERWEEKIFRDGHTAAVRTAVFSPDGKLLVSAGEDKQVIVWDFTRRMRLKTLIAHQGVVNTVAFSPDGKWFITGDEQKTAIVWDANRFEQETVWRDQPGPIRASCFSPDGRLVIYAAGDVSITRETGTWKKLHELPGELSYGDFLFPNNRLVQDSLGRTWDLYTGASLTGRQEAWEGNWAALSPDHKQLAIVEANGYLKFVDCARGKVLQRSLAHHDHGRAVAYSPDGKLLATGAERVVLWDAASMTKIVPLEYESIVWSVVFSRDGRWLISTHGDGSILIWDVANRELEANLRQHSGGVRGIAFSPNGKRLATASEDHSVILWDAASGTKEAVFTTHKTRVAAVAFSADERWIISADQSDILIRHNLDSDEPPLTIVPTTQEASYCVAVSPDDRFVATSFAIYETKTGSRVTPQGNWTNVYSAAFSDSGRLLMGVTDKGEVVVLETATWREVARQKWTESPLVSMSVSADGTYLVTGEDDRKVRLGTINPLRQIGVVGEHNARVKAVAFSPDGRYVASAGDDKMVALWDVSRRKLVTTIGTHTSPIYALAFSPDGKRLITGEHDRSVRQYTRQRTLWGFSLD